MGLGWLLEACQAHEKVALEHGSKSTKYELQGSCSDPVHENLSFLKTAKLPQECNEDNWHEMDFFKSIQKIDDTHLRKKSKFG